MGSIQELTRRIVMAVAIGSAAGMAPQLANLRANTFTAHVQPLYLTPSGCGPTGGVRIYQDWGPGYLNSQCIRYYNGTGNDNLQNRYFISLGSGSCGSSCVIVGSNASDVDTGGSNAGGYLTCTEGSGTTFNWSFNTNGQYVGSHCNDHSGYIYVTS